MRIFGPGVAVTVTFAKFLAATASLAFATLSALPAHADDGTMDGERPVWCPGRADVAIEGARAGLGGLALKAQSRKALKVVAIGSSSTAGSDLSDPGFAYPSHFEKRLNGLFGGGIVRVVNKGRGGETLDQTVARFQADVTREAPDLVIWQLGVNDVVRQQDPALSEPIVEDGLKILAALKAPIVLMDMQVAPKVTRSPTLEPMRAMIKRVASRNGALLWSRFSLMEGILASHKAELVDLVRPDELHMTVPMHICTGQVLAEMIAAGVTSAMMAEAPAPQGNAY